MPWRHREPCQQRHRGDPRPRKDGAAASPLPPVQRTSENVVSPSSGPFPGRHRRSTPRGVGTVFLELTFSRSAASGISIPGSQPRNRKQPAKVLLGCASISSKKTM